MKNDFTTTCSIVVTLNSLLVAYTKSDTYCCNYVNPDHKLTIYYSVFYGKA